MATFHHLQGLQNIRLGLGNDLSFHSGSEFETMSPFERNSPLLQYGRILHDCIISLAVLPTLQPSSRPRPTVRVEAAATFSPPSPPTSGSHAPELLFGTTTAWSPSKLMQAATGAIVNIFNRPCVRAVYLIAPSFVIALLFLWLYIFSIFWALGCMQWTVNYYLSLNWIQEFLSFAIWQIEPDPGNDWDNQLLR